MLFKKQSSSKKERLEADYTRTLKRMTAQTKRATTMISATNLSTLEGLNSICKQAAERRYY